MIYSNKAKPEAAKFKKDPEPPLLIYDGYYICNGSIDACFFLSESIIFILVNKSEVRILYTQNFTPGIFDDTFSLNDPNRNTSIDGKLNDPNERKKY